MVIKKQLFLMVTLFAISSLYGSEEGNGNQKTSRLATPEEIISQFNWNFRTDCMLSMPDGYFFDKDGCMRIELRETIEKFTQRRLTANQIRNSLVMAAVTQHNKAFKFEEKLEKVRLELENLKKTPPSASIEIPKSGKNSIKLKKSTLILGTVCLGITLYSVLLYNGRTAPGMPFFEQYIAGSAKAAFNCGFATNIKTGLKTAHTATLGALCNGMYRVFDTAFPLNK